MQNFSVESFLPVFIPEQKTQNKGNHNECQTEKKLSGHGHSSNSRVVS